MVKKKLKQPLVSILKLGWFSKQQQVKFQNEFNQKAQIHINQIQINLILNDKI
jgi:hypothetical protein